MSHAKSLKGTAPAHALLPISWLGTDTHAAGVLATAHDLLAAQKIVAQCLPAGFSKACQAAQIHQQQLTLSVPSAAFASKLRQLTPRILDTLHHHGWQVDKIRIVVQKSRVPMTPPPLPKDTNVLDQSGLVAFQHLHQQLPAGPLADAVHQLLRRHHQG